MKIMRVVFAVIASTLVLFTAAPAQAAVGCYGDYCSGRDPVNTNCANDARTVASATTTVMVAEVGGEPHMEESGTIEVRWSAVCKTNWARLSLFRGHPASNRLTLTQDTGYRQDRWIAGWNPGISAGTYYTPMIYSPVKRVYAHLDGGCGRCATHWV